MEGQEGADPAGQEQPSNGPAEHAGKMRFNFRTKANSVSNMPAKCSSGTKWHFACGARMTLISLIVHAVELELGAVCHAGPLACLDNSHHGELRFRLLQQNSDRSAVHCLKPSVLALQVVYIKAYVKLEANIANVVGCNQMRYQNVLTSRIRTGAISLVLAPDNDTADAIRSE